MGNCHIYEEHFETASLQIQRTPKSFPTIFIKELRENINDYEVNDFEIQDYKYHDALKYEIVV
jgi:thymidylate synthase